MKRKGYKIGLFISIVICCLSQPASSQSDEEQLKELERYIENQDQSVDYTDLVDYLVLNQDFLDINQATYQEFLSIKGITPVCVKAIIKHRLDYGAFVSLLELQTIDEIPFESLKILTSVLSLNVKDLDYKQLWPILKKSDREIIIKMSTSRPVAIGYLPFGIDSTLHYSGSPNMYQLRFRGKVNSKVLYGFNAEKDEGEDFFSSGNNKGFDFYSAHFFISKRGWVKKIALGDFQASFGQGLTISSGLGFGKSALVLNVMQNNSGLRPFRSFNENEFLRGGGITFGVKNLESTVFVSRNKIDGTLYNSPDDGQNEVVTSLVTTGLHRTDLERSKKNAVNEFLIGQNLSYKFKNVNLGLITVYHSYDKPIFVNDRLYNRYYFSGKSYLKNGLHLNYWYKNLNIIGEASIGSSNSNGYIVGALISLASDLDLVLAHRYYSKNFIWNKSNAFSENSNPNNEVGTYFGMVFKWTKKHIFSCYVDRYSMPWYGFYVDGRGRGIDFLTEFNFKPNKSTVFYIRFKNKLELENVEIDNYNGLYFTEKMNFRIHAETKITPVISFKSRIEFSNYRNIGVNSFLGNLIYMDLIYRPSNSKFSITTRLCFFNVNDYKARIYALENDVLYTWTVPGFSGSGSKIYSIFKFKYKNLTTQMRYALIKYYDRNTIGTLYNAVPSNYVHEINFLIRYVFD